MTYPTPEFVVMKRSSYEEDSAYFACAQLEALRHCTVPSMIFPNPSLNLGSSTISRLATDSVSCNAAATHEMGDSFYCAPFLLPNSPALTCVVAGAASAGTTAAAWLTLQPPSNTVIRR